MKESISARVDNDLAAIIESVAAYHDIPKSRAIELLLREALNSRALRYRMEQLDAKMDIMIESLGGEPVAREAVSERFETVSKRGLPEAASGVDLAEQPHPFFRSTGDYTDRSEEEKSFVEELVAERDAIERADGEAQQGADE
jgi:antitoxin component of RelBE/YafQ-DinJ toxin-antitoxin module